MVDKWKSILQGLPAAKIRTDRIGRKKLAYEARGCTYGWYVSFKYESTSDLVGHKLDLRLRQDDDIIKFMTTSISEDYIPDEVNKMTRSGKTPIDIFDLIFDIEGGE